MMRQYQAAWFLLALAVLAGCGAHTPRKQIAAGNDVVKQFTERTARLCVGATPVLSKAECNDRQDLSRRAQDALDVATTAVAACPAEGGCPDGTAAVSAAQAILLQLETYVYRGN